MAALETAGRPRGRSWLMRAYVTVWIILASFAVTYLAAAALKPELLAEYFPATQEQIDAVQNQRAIIRLTSEAQNLRQILGDVQRELAQLKTTISTDSEQEHGLLDRIAALEEQTRRATGDGARSDIIKFAGGAETASHASAAPVIKPKVVTAPPPASAQIETGAIGQPIAFGPAVVTPVRTGPVAVHLSKWPSLDAVRLAWGQLAEQHASALEKLRPRYKAITVGTEPPSYQLLAGPVANAEEGNRICAVLRVKRVGCRVGQIEGEAL